MNELTNRLGLEYGVKFYINRSDRYMDLIFELSFESGIYWSYTEGSMGDMVIVYLRRKYERIVF